MALFGPDLAGGMRRLYRPSNPAGLWLALLFVVLLVVINQIMQMVFAMGVTAVMFRGGDVNPGDVIKSYMIGIFPASVVTALCAVGFARLNGGQAAGVLSLRRPHFGLLGWPAVLILFMVAIYAAIIILALALNLDLSQYAPTEGQDNADQIGLVKQAMFDIAHDPKLFLLVLPSVVLGAPLAEEFMFRGQLFSALSLSRLGVAGATLITAALWSLLHVTEPWFSVALIFIMGLVFGFLMWRFGSIWVTIACHALWNGAYSLIMFAGVGS